MYNKNELCENLNLKALEQLFINLQYEIELWTDLTQQLLNNKIENFKSKIRQETNEKTKSLIVFNFLPGNGKIFILKNENSSNFLGKFIINSNDFIENLSNSQLNDKPKIFFFLPFEQGNNKNKKLNI